MNFHIVKRKPSFGQARELAQDETLESLKAAGISVSDFDAANFGTVPPGYVFRNANNHADQWYVAREWFDANYDA